jgi:predicted dithiol-disulfide oxidoreductase (DUF899 family)
MDHQQPPAAKPRSRTRLVVQAVFSLALVVAIFYYLLKGIDLTLVWAEILAMTWREDATLLAIAAWNLATYGLLWMSVTPGLGFGRAMVMTQAASAVTNTVPTVGPAIGVGMTYSMLRSWGYSGSRTSAAVLVSGVWNTFAKLGLPVLALALLALQGNASGARVTLALAGIAALVAAIVVFALLLRSEQLIYHFMFGSSYEAGCPVCSSIADTLDPNAIHLRARDVTLICSSRAPLDKLLAYRQRMGWSFDWVSTAGSDFHRDLGFVHTEEELKPFLEGEIPPTVNQMAEACSTDVVSYVSEGPGLSAYALSDGTVYRTYVTTARGLEPAMGYYGLLDRTPMGRHEEGEQTHWLRRHDEYGKT